MAASWLLRSSIAFLPKGRSFFTNAAARYAIQIEMPALSPTMVEGTITKWLIAEGDNVEIGDAMCEVETDKAVVTMEAIEEGRLAKILVPEGTSNIKINVPIAILAEEDEDITEAAKMAVQTRTHHRQESVPATASTPSTQLPAANTSSQLKTSQIRISPAVRHVSQQYGVDLSRIAGSGPRGILLKGDLLEFIQKNKIQPKLFGTEPQPPATPARASNSVASFAAEEKHALQANDFEDNDLSNVRKVIAKRLTESKQKIPHSYSSIQCTITRLLLLRKELAQEGIKLSVNDFVIKAAAATLRQVPEVNSVWADGAVQQASTVDVSVAVATDGGLITPIIKNASGKRLGEIATEIRELAGRAREGKLKPDEFQGGTFTISNLGMFGIREFTAVINPPQTCIMAVGGTRLVPSSVKVDMDSDNDVMEIAHDVDSVMTVTLSSDARVVDDVIATKFLNKFRRNVENPLLIGML